MTSFRQNPALAVAGLLAAIGALPLLNASWLFAVVPLAAVLFAVWAWRSGTDATEAGLRVRALFGKREIAWSRIAALVPAQRTVVAALTDGGHVTLTAVRPQDLPELVAASGHELGETPAQ
ncbi:MAG: PH domain-containing protein [Streptomycetaceae bacterium]|nr:PH domain-containing protein [Streptomycetaceae bacterium]